MKRILIITISLSEKNGGGRLSRDLVKGLCQKYQMKVFSGKEKDDFGELPNCQIFRILPVDSFFSKLRNPFIFLMCLYKILRLSKKIDFIHCFMDYPYSFLGAVISFIKRKPLFLNALGTYSLVPFKTWPDKWFHRFALKRAKKIICISRFTEKELRKKINLSNTVVINPGIDFKKFAEFIPSPKKQGKIILGAGGLGDRKGYHISIPAVGQVKKKYSNIKYYIVGDQSNKRYFNKLKDLVERYHLEKNVVFLEKISDKELIKLYYSANLFLLTPINIKGNFEGFGLVYLEAGTCRKPVIGTYGSGVEDAVKDGVTGLLVPQKDIKKTAKAILKLLDNSDLAKKLGKNGRKRAQQMSLDNVTKKYIKVYDQS